MDSEQEVSCVDGPAPLHRRRDPQVGTRSALVGVLPSACPGTAITKDHKLGAENNRNSSTQLWRPESESEVPQGRPAPTPNPGLQGRHLVAPHLANSKDVRSSTPGTGTKAKEYSSYYKSQY